MKKHGISKNDLVTLESISVLSLIFSIGTVAGAVCYALDKELLFSVFKSGYVPVKTNTDYTICFLRTALPSITFLILTFFAGMCTFGQVLGVILILVRGIGTGESAAGLYSAKGIHAIPEAVFVMTPEMLLSAFISIIAVRELIRTSSAILSCWNNGCCRDERYMNIKLYCVKFIVLSLIAILLSAVSAAINCIFSSMNK